MPSADVGSATQSGAPAAACATIARLRKKCIAQDVEIADGAASGMPHAPSAAMAWLLRFPLLPLLEK